MKEIERIFNLIREHGGVNCLSPQTAERIAKAILQYVIKARIEGAESIYRSDITTEDYIAELKAKLNGFDCIADADTSTSMD